MAARKSAKKPPAEKAGGASDWRDAPRSGVTFQVPDSDFERAAQSQKAFLEELADTIGAGEALTGEMERSIAAGAIRAFANSIPLEQKKPRGQPPQFDHGSEALVFVTLRARGKKPSEAYILIADRVGVEWQAVERAMRKHAPGAARLLGETFALPDIPNNLFKE